MDRTLLHGGVYDSHWIPDEGWIHLPGQHIRIRSGYNWQIYRIAPNGTAYWLNDAWTGGMAHDYASWEVQR